MSFFSSDNNDHLEKSHGNNVFKTVLLVVGEVVGSGILSLPQGLFKNNKTTKQQNNKQTKTKKLLTKAQCWVTFYQ